MGRTREQEIGSSRPMREGRLNQVHTDGETKMRISSHGHALGVAMGGWFIVLAIACGGLLDATNPVSEALASVASESGTLLCAPSQEQIVACANQAAGDACTL